MTTPNITKIRQLIAQSKSEDDENGLLLDFARSKLATLHRTIQLPEVNPGTALARFIIQYIEHSPDFLEAMTVLMQEAELYEHGKVFLAIAEDFFITPPEIVQHQSGMVSLLGQAYLSHRLIEEINDRIQVTCGAPLSPMDMNISNIMVHALLGEEYANNLDMAVHYAIETLFDSNGLMHSPQCSSYLATHQGSHWSEVLERWPSLAGDASISPDIEDWLKI